jgi:DMSO reductase family type II enzyme chaperone
MSLDAARTEEETSEVDLALARSLFYHCLALALQPPTEEMVCSFAASAGDLSAAAALLDRETDSKLTPAVAILRGKLLSVEALSSSYHRLFGHTARGSVPPYETEYGAEALFQQPYEISDLMGFYRAFGLSFNAAERERPDHVSCECEFLSFLTLKEAYALSHKENSMLEQTRKANRLFLRDHLGHFAPAFAHRLTREDPDCFYGAVGNLCTRFVAGECARLGVPVGSQNLDLRPAADDRVPMACGENGPCPIGSGTSADEEP